MPSRDVAVTRRLAAFFALEDDWSRPMPPLGASDVATGVGLEAIGILTLELARSAGAFEDVDSPWWVIYLVMSAAALPLVWRRRFPLAVAVYLATHMFVTGVTMAPVMGQLSLQICYFVGLFSAMAWGRSRRTALLVSGAILAFMLSWLAWQFAVGSGLQQFVDENDDAESHGFLPPIPSVVLLTYVVNVVYFLGAIVGGQVAWRSARQRGALATQAATIAAQSDTLRRRAVVDERLRIARELHDVVGHHVSVIGVQAAGARRVLDHDQAAASDALGTIEESSREAVTQMRSLLGTLREIEQDVDGGSLSGRAPEPGVDDLPALVASRNDDRLTTTYDVVTDRDGGPGRLPRPVALSLYRTAQEALANIVRHSTARRASVTLRVVEDASTPYAEVEVLDDGRPRSGTSGSGLGLLGIRERVASHRGECDIGPRATHGFRVRVRVPLRGGEDGSAGA
ncbi:sensor histidine kinase [Nocardioides sp.]|uniref:sensor histidine kinase n=1 Tax=Nocardioides sp. TaxID=35761 RepID=UPI002ED06375